MQRQVNPIRYVILGFIIQLISGVFITRLFLIIKNKIDSFETKKKTKLNPLNLTFINQTTPFQGNNLILNNELELDSNFNSILREVEEKFKFEDIHLNVMVFLLN
uniref:Uncharacterized protein n=1 Tax=viral metagenome TaxID=1070528 RepID=A0A6C0KY25_9ZZZZ